MTMTIGIRDPRDGPCYFSAKSEEDVVTQGSSRTHKMENVNYTTTQP